MRQNRRLAGLALALMLALASAVTGLAFSYARPVSDPVLIAYLQAGGDLCDGSGGVHHRGILCDCCPTGPAVIPDPVALPRPADYILTRTPIFAATPMLPDTPRDPAHDVRGPPRSGLSPHPYQPGPATAVRRRACPDENGPILKPLTLTLAALALASAATAEDFTKGTLTIVAPYAAATTPGQLSDAGFLKIVNTGNAPDYLTGVFGDFGILTLHLTTIDANGVAKMTHIESLEVPAHSSVELKHASYHIMMMELKHPLKKGDKVAATLVFKNAGPVQIEFTIGDGAMGGMNMGG